MTPDTMAANEAGDLLTIVVLTVVASFFFLPAMLAIGRAHVNALVIFLLSLYGGLFAFLLFKPALLVVWLVALVWALKRQAGYVPAAVTAAATPVAASVDAPDTLTTPPAARQKSGWLKRALKILLWIVAVLVLLFVLFTAGVYVANTEGVATSASSVPFTTGTPVPADTFFGQ